ncbi:MAG: hypothetical protein V1916_03145 [Patescibacteria group bacterium]
MRQLRQVGLFLVRHWRFIAYPVLLSLCFCYFAYFQRVPTFPDPDSFYHAKAAVLLPQQGIQTTFPWLQATVLKSSFIDQHFLYHALLVPFVTLMDPLWGVKVATALLCSALAILFYWFLRQYQVKFAFLGTLILLASTPLIFRIGLVKAPVLSIILLLLGLHLMFQHRTRALFFLSFFYVWAYGGFILILFAAGTFALVSLITRWWQRFGREPLSVTLRTSLELRTFFACLAGVAAGVLINPYFPQNLSYYWHQLVQIGIVNYQGIIAVGNEWYPYRLVDLVTGTAMVTVVILIGTLALAVYSRRLSRRTVTVFIVFVLFLAFTLKSRRYVEYYVPFALLYGMFACGDVLRDVPWQRVRKAVVTFASRQWVLAAVMIVYLATAVPAMVYHDVLQTQRDYRGGISLQRFREPATWLREHTAPGTTVFHSSWDEFPVLFYYNSDNYYTAGLDPTFTYEYSPELYRKMVAITTGQQRENVYEDVRNGFGASYVFVEKNHQAMESVIRAEPRFREVYRGAEATIFEVR